MSQLKPPIHHFFIRPDFITFSSLFHQTRFHHFFISFSSPLGMRKVEDVSAETSVHRAYRHIPHKWARSIGPTRLIPADHGDKRSRYVLIWLFLYCLALCSPTGSVHRAVHRAYRDIPHKWARSIGPTGLIPADHGDKRSHYVLI